MDDNREIKYRAWYKTTGVMLIPISIDQRAKMVLFEGSWGWIPFHELILMLFTGLQDCKFKDIYEGDIILTYDSLCEVKWSEWDDHQGFDIDCDDENLEVKGNIYENPNLLK